jgi:23S rRNA (guanosine2251-2'-O)-methyltransferase
MIKRPRYRLIMGKNCLEEVLKDDYERLVEVYTSEKKESPLVHALLQKGVVVHFVGKRDLTTLVDSDSHQSFVAAVHEKGHRTLKEFFLDFREKKKGVVLALDAIQDPQNLGAILRAAECFGVDAVVYSKNRGVDVTPVVSKVSVGASELVPIFKVSNLAEAIKQFKEESFRVVAASISESAESLNHYEFSKKTVIVLGSEGEGIQKLILQNVDDIVYIPMLGKIDSLNVSQASAVILAFVNAKKE